MLAAFGAGVIFFVALLAWAGGALRVNTPDGTIVIEDLPRDAEVLVDGKTVTGFTNGEELLAQLQTVVPFLLEDRLRAAGAKFEHALAPGACHVVRDGDLITGQNPASSEMIAKTLMDMNLLHRNVGRHERDLSHGRVVVEVHASPAAADQAATQSRCAARSPPASPFRARAEAAPRALHWAIPDQGCGPPRRG